MPGRMKLKLFVSWEIFGGANVPAGCVMLPDPVSVNAPWLVCPGSVWVRTRFIDPVAPVNAPVPPVTIPGKSETDCDRSATE